MSAQKLDASLVNTLNLDLHANKYTTSHKNKEVSPPNDVSGLGMGPESLLRAGMEYDCVKYGILRHVVNISK